MALALLGRAFDYELDRALLKAGVAQGPYPVKVIVTGSSGNEVHLAMPTRPV